MFPYAEEQFTPDEEAILRRYVTNLHLPVFALVNLPEVVKGALFARVLALPEEPAPAVPRRVRGRPRHLGRSLAGRDLGLERAEQLYEKVFVEYGDDSVAQLGGVHLACEQSSNVSPRSRVGTPHVVPGAVDPLHRLRQPARERPLPVFRPPESSTRPTAPAMSGTWTACSTPTAACAHHAGPGGQRFPQQAGDTDFVYRQAVKANRSTPCGAAAGGVALQHRPLRDGPVLRAAAAADAGPPPPSDSVRMGGPDRLVSVAASCTNRPQPRGSLPQDSHDEVNVRSAESTAPSGIVSAAWQSPPPFAPIPTPSPDLDQLSALGGFATFEAWTIARS